MKLEKFPVLQGVGYEFRTPEGTVVGRILECIGGDAWSVKVEGKRWRLPPGHNSRLIYRRGLIDVTYVRTRDDAARLLTKSVESKRKILDWP